MTVDIPFAYFRLIDLMIMTISMVVASDIFIPKTLNGQRFFTYLYSQISTALY